MKASLIVTGLLFGGVLLAEADFGQLCSDGAKAAKEKDFVTAEAKYAEAMKAAADSQQKCKAVLGVHPNARFDTDYRISAASMLPLAEKLLQEGRVEDVAYYEPFYLKDFVAKKSIVRGLF